MAIVLYDSLLFPVLEIIFVEDVYLSGRRKYKGPGHQPLLLFDPLEPGRAWAAFRVLYASFPVAGVVLEFLFIFPHIDGLDVRNEKDRMTIIMRSQQTI